MKIGIKVRKRGRGLNMMITGMKMVTKINIMQR